MYSFFANRKVKQISHFVSVKPRLIYDQSITSTSGIRFYYANPSEAPDPIDANVFLTELTMWNSGNQRILESDILEAIKVNYPEAARVLENKIVKSERPAVANFKLVLEPPPSSFSLTWEKFDPGFGVAVQTIYAAKERVVDDPVVDGYIEGTTLRAYKPLQTAEYGYRTYYGVTLGLFITLNVIVWKVDWESIPFLNFPIGALFVMITQALIIAIGIGAGKLAQRLLAKRGPPF